MKIPIMTLFATLSLTWVSPTVYADSNDPKLPPPNINPSAAQGMVIGSLISTAGLVTPPSSPDAHDGRVVVWGYRKNGHSGNYNWNGHNVGFEQGSETFRANSPLFETVKDFNDPNHPLYAQTVVRLFTTAHTFLALTAEGELWGWGDSLHGTAGCLKTGFETGVDNDSRFTDYAIVYNTYNTVHDGRIRGPHYQARPCPSFSRTHPNPDLRKKVIYVDGGEYNVIAMTADKHVYTWGSDLFSQTVYAGEYHIAGKTIVIPTGDKGEPVDITDFFVDAEGNPEEVIMIGGAYEGQYAVTANARTGKRSLWAWGRSFGKSLVSDRTDLSVRTPTRLTQYAPYADRIVYVNGGYGWTAVLLSDGSVYASGLTRHIGQGNGSAGDSYYTFAPKLVMGKDSVTGQDSGFPAVSRLIVRFAGAVAVPIDDPQAIWTWGITNGSAYKQVYGDRPIRRQLAGNLKYVGVTKEAIFYMTDDNRLFGIGYGDQRVINLCSAGNFSITWDRQRGHYVRKNNANWFHKPDKPGGVQIRWDYLLDKTWNDYCKDIPGTADSDRLKRREWTPWDDGRDGPIPSPTPLQYCQDAAAC